MTHRGVSDTRHPSRAKRELDYRPAVALEEGMRRSIRWCIEQGQL